MKVIRGGEKMTVEIKLRADCDFENSSETNKLWNALGIGTYENDGSVYWAVGGRKPPLRVFRDDRQVVYVLV